MSSLSKVSALSSCVLAVALAAACSSAPTAALIPPPPEPDQPASTEPGAEACAVAAESCDDGDACTEDSVPGASCTSSCSHQRITRCVSGDGCCPSGCAPSADADCKPARPASCDDGDPCTRDERDGASCTHSPITASVTGDGCCPTGATRASDGDCKAGYAEACTADAQCGTGICHPLGGYCTRACNPSVKLGVECGGFGMICGRPFTTGTHCIFIDDSGPDGDDRMLGVGSATVGRLETADDLDIFGVDLATGAHAVVLQPDPGALVDLAFDVWDESGAKGFTINTTGAGQAEDQNTINVGTAGRYFIGVRSVNAINGNYRLTVQ